MADPRRTENELQRDRAEFYRHLTELTTLVEELGTSKAKRVMEIVMALKNNPKFILLTITYEATPNDLSSLSTEGGD